MSNQAGTNISRAGYDGWYCIYGDAPRDIAGPYGIGDQRSSGISAARDGAAYYRGQRSTATAPHPTGRIIT